jgi:hypothetical protein
MAEHFMWGFLTVDGLDVFSMDNISVSFNAPFSLETQL